MPCIDATKSTFLSQIWNYSQEALILNHSVVKLLDVTSSQGKALVSMKGSMGFAHKGDMMTEAELRESGLSSHPSLSVSMCQGSLRSAWAWNMLISTSDV